MKTINYLLITLLSLSLLSCQESIPTDGYQYLAKDIVRDIYDNTLTQPITMVATLDKASTWLDAYNDTDARYAIEDKYFNKIAPRINGDTIKVIHYYGEYITIVHNNKSIGELGAKWAIVDNLNSYISLENTDGVIWKCTHEYLSGDSLMNFTVQKSSIDNYKVELTAKRTRFYANSPISAQSIETISPLNFVSNNDFSSINTPLDINSGSLNIKLLSESSQVIDGDDIIVDFNGNNSYFNPLISFRADKFYFTDYNYYY